MSPANVAVSSGQRVRFVNQSSSAHEIASNPHPVHTDCPPVNQVGLLNPGQSRETGTLSVPRPCGYHDHLDPTNPTLQGTITVNP